MLLLLVSFLYGVLIILGLNLFLSSSYNVSKSTMLKYVQGIYPVLQREKSIAINNLLLPEDVLLEILARLPVKSLLRFRSVSKSWRDIIKEPTFITKHHLTQVALKDGKCVSVKNHWEHPYVFGFVAEVEQGGNKFTRWELPFLKRLPHDYLHAAGPCNGIFIISDGYHQLFLWNPATREYKALPPSLEMSVSDRISCVGFGIDPISKDYKVVMLWHFGSLYHYTFIGKVEVLSLSSTDSCRPKSETWKTIDVVPSIRSVLHSKNQVYANGKYYWVVPSLESSDGPLHPYKIMWFDMGAEVFGLIDEPYWFASPHNRIAVVKGSLALIKRAHIVEENKSKSMFEIWIIDDYPWTKYATIGPLKNYDQVPFGFWNDQEVFMVEFTERDQVFRLFSYDIKTNAIKKKMEGLHMHIQNMFHSSVDMYSESLISFMG